MQLTGSLTPPLHGCAISHSWVFPQHCKNKRKINSKVWQLWHFVHSWCIYEQAPPCHKPDLNVPHIETPSRHASLFTERVSFQFGLWTPARPTSSSVTMAGASQVAGSAMMTTTVGTWAMRTSGISVVSEGRLLRGLRKVSRSQESLAVPGKSGLIFVAGASNRRGNCFTARYFSAVWHHRSHVQNDLVLIFTHTGLGKVCLLLATKYHCFFQIIDLDHTLTLQIFPVSTTHKWDTIAMDNGVWVGISTLHMGSMSSSSSWLIQMNFFFVSFSFVGIFFGLFWCFDSCFLKIKIVSCLLFCLREKEHCE